MEPILTSAMYCGWTVAPCSLDICTDDRFVVLDKWKNVPLVVDNFTVGNHRNPWVHLPSDALDALILYRKDGNKILQVIGDNDTVYMELKVYTEDLDEALCIVGRYADNISGLGITIILSLSHS